MERVAKVVIDAHFKVQVWPCGIAGTANLRDALALDYPVSLCHKKP